MAFVDLVKLSVCGGQGGNGTVAYRRELKVDRGGPFGGNGGRGGNIIFVGDEGLSTLLDLRYNRNIKGQSGENGKHKGMYGACADHTMVRVPVGTIIYDEDSGLVIGDIVKHKQEIIVALGGRGGRGNMSFASNTNKCPDFCEKGEPGQERNIRCELKVLADCGLVGFPSVGKSTIIAAVSAARPKIASYHFTTLVPNLGMVDVGDGRSFVMADLPGIIENAHMGAGLGLQFLRHIERCKVIVHVLDMASTDGRDPYEDYLTINNELKAYKMNLSKRPQIIVANKMDIPTAKENLIKFKEKVDAPVIEISAYTRDNLSELIYKVADTLAVTEDFSLFEEDEKELVVNYEFKSEEPFFTIEKIGNQEWDVTGDKLKRLFVMTDWTSDMSVNRFIRQMRSYGLDEELRKAGCQNGDTVSIYDWDFEYFD